MESKVAIIILVLLSISYCEVKYPQPYLDNGIDFNNTKKMTQLIQVVRAYPHAISEVSHQKRVIFRLQDNQKIYDNIRKDLIRKQKRDKIIIITLGVALPIVAGFVGWGVWKIMR